MQGQPSQRLPNGMLPGSDTSGSEIIPASLAATNPHEAGTMGISEIAV